MMIETISVKSLATNIGKEIDDRLSMIQRRTKIEIIDCKVNTYQENSIGHTWALAVILYKKI
jgi:hypothetical protein